MGKKKGDAAPAPLVKLDSVIRVIRGVRVMLDSDLAELYGVPTKALNQAVDRNIDRFPEDFAFRLTAHEVTDHLTPIVVGSGGSRGGRRTLPWVFTEHGVAMLASVLRSPQAAQVCIEIVRAFVRLRRLLATPGELATMLKQLADTVQDHDDQLRVITDVLRKMMEPPSPATPTRKIGFVDTETTT